MQIVNAFTVDLEDWYQAITSINAQRDKWDSFESRVEKNTRRLLSLLAAHRIQATFFVLGRVAHDFPDLIREIDTAGHEIGVHGYWHQMVDRLTQEEFSQEMDLSLETLRPLTRQPILGHRAPYFSINGRSLWALDVLREKGFKYDSSFFPTRNPLYGYPESPRFPHRVKRNTLVEFPMSTAIWGGMTVPIAGGLYMRAFPYHLIRAGIRQLNRQGQAAIIYLHPWELDTKHRYNKVTLREWIVQYTRRGSLHSKLQRLFTDFAFQPLCKLLESVN